MKVTLYQLIFFESVNAKTLAVFAKKIFANVTVGTASGEEPLSASTLPRCVQSTELNIRNKEKNFRKYQGSKNQDQFMPRIQASTIKFFNSSTRGARHCGQHSRCERGRPRASRTHQKSREGCDNQ